jgi:hypothetical protein
VVFTPKYRRKALYGSLRKRLGSLFRELARHKECEIGEGHLMVDHVHMFISIPPKFSASSLIIGPTYGLTPFPCVAAADASLINLDLPPQPSGLGTFPWRARLYRSFAREQQQIVLVADDSHQPATAARLQTVLAGRAIDALFIHGDHSYAGVKADYTLYYPFLAPGGVVAFHDIVPASPDLAFGVAEFWQELKKTETTVEFVADWKQGGFGIGVVKKPAELRP